MNQERNVWQQTAYDLANRVSVSFCTYVCLYICMYDICVVYTCLLNILSWYTLFHSHVCAHTHIHTHTHTHTHTHMHKHTQVAEEHNLHSVRKLQLYEKSWVKLTTRFSLVLSSKETQQVHTTCIYHHMILTHWPRVVK